MAELPFRYEVDDGIATITLDRPDQLNALTFEIYRKLTDTFYKLRFDDDVKVVVITGAGKGFCGGGDVDDIIGQLFEKDTRSVIEFTRMTGELIENMRRLDRPIVGAINGTAAGAGAVIALACDLRVVSERAKFHFLFSKVGLTGADMGAGWLLPRVVGLGRASEWLLLGDGVDAETAKAAGLATRVVPPEDVLTEAMTLARRLADGPTLAHSMTKRMLNDEAHMDLSSAIEAEALAQAILLKGQDHRVFYDAWRAGEQPKFTGR
ncbi:MAG: enoyl-CoA hydratase family protein [Planctomycetota bacterium]|nr:enoyl-CoA hydratase family protein [Planctomycetota bacterium]